MSEDEQWIEWDGGEMPVHPYALVAMRFRNGDVSESALACWWIDRWSNLWEHSTPDHGEDIIAYRIIPCT